VTVDRLTVDAPRDRSLTVQSKRAKQLLAPEVFESALVKLGVVNNVLAHKVGKGLALLRETQMLAKQVGEVMFVKSCETNVNVFLTELCAIIKQMVDTVGDQKLGVLSQMERVRRTMKEDTDTDVKGDIEGTQAWSNNMDKAVALVRLAQKNLDAVIETVTEIRQLATAAHTTDVEKIILKWEHNLQQFVTTGCVPTPPTEVAEAPEPEPPSQPDDTEPPPPPPPPPPHGSVQVLAPSFSSAPPLLTLCKVEHRRRETDSDASYYSVYPIICTDRHGHQWECVKRHADFEQLRQSVRTAFAGSDGLDTFCYDVPQPQANGTEVPVRRLSPRDPPLFAAAVTGMYVPEAFRFLSRSHCQ
jgi:hypothetical protein